MVLIGVAPGWDEQAGKLTVHRDYTDAVLRAGALPVLLPLTDGESVLRSMLDRVDGVLFTGGGDVSPARYGEAALPCCGEICPARDDFEFALLAQALAMDRPILAVCRGLQVLNTALGGALYASAEDTQGIHEYSSVTVSADGAVLIAGNAASGGNGQSGGGAVPSRRRIPPSPRPAEPGRHSAGCARPFHARRICAPRRCARCRPAGLRPPGRRPCGPAPRESRPFPPHRR